MFSQSDVQMMARALQLARTAIYRSRPNPAVGCVLVRDGEIVGEGATQVCGGNHAEIEALNSAGDASGATAYVTLEPCAHQGKTGPCSEALVKAGISRCVVAIEDPNPSVSGKGIQQLRDAGIQVDTGLLMDEAWAINAGFLQRMATGKPRVRLKLAASMDGRTAMASGESFWITGPAARADVQRWRARSDAIVTGVETVIADNPAMTVRDDTLDIAQQPLRVICDSQRRTQPDAAILQQPGTTLIAHTQSMGSEYFDCSKYSDPIDVEEASLPGTDGRVGLAALVQLLGERQCNDILVECGSRLAAAFLQAGLVDEIILYQAPVLLGSAGRPLVGLELSTMAEKWELQILESRRIGADTRLILAPKSS